MAHRYGCPHTDVFGFMGLLSSAGAVRHGIYEDIGTPQKSDLQEWHLLRIMVDANGNN